MNGAPITTFFVIACVLIFGLSYCIRIFERPYFTFNFVDSDVTFYNFQDLPSTMWFTIITMTSVGYGGIISTTPIGRGITLVVAISGAFLLSLLVAIITNWFEMEEQKTEAISKMQRDRFAGECVRIGFQYNIARSKRYRLISSGNEDEEHIPTMQELNLMKDKMHAAALKFKNAAASEHSNKEQEKRDKESKILKQQVLDLNDKFDYFICMMLRGKMMPLEDLAEPKPIAKKVKED